MNPLVMCMGQCTSYA